jgi:RND superfamily putative drug exporter
MATAILVDALIVRTVLVPAVMHTLGKANWYLPGWLQQRLPRLEIEAVTELEHEEDVELPRERELTPAG